MSTSRHAGKIHLSLSAGGNTPIECVVETPIGGCSWIRRAESPSLTIDPSRPWHLGLAWGPTAEPNLEVGGDNPDFLTKPHSGGESFAFSFELDPSYESEAFFPVDESSYHAECEVDLATRIVWFQLPEGQSIHLLDWTLESNGLYPLGEFVGSWFSQRNSEGTLPFEIGWEVVSYDEEAVHLPCTTKDYGMETGLHIPVELLDDPIRNGSKFPEHGFNPWNEDQKSRIVSHLEQELVRLRDWTERDASSRKVQVSVGQ